MKKRFEWIDNVRALAMVGMILYHASWDLVYLYGLKWNWFRSDFAFFWQQSICWTFILLSGFCWSFSRKPLKQGMIISGAGILVSIVTSFLDSGSRIIFGVLTLLGMAAFIMIPLEKKLKNIKATKGLIIMFVLFAVTYSVNDRALGFYGIKLVELPMELYHGMFATFLGFTEFGFYSADYFSIFPWIFLYFSGYFLYRIWKERGCPELPVINRKFPILTKMGSYSLLIYLLHQPMIYLALEVAYKR